MIPLRRVDDTGIATPGGNEDCSAELVLATEVLRQESAERRWAQERLATAYATLATAYEETIRGWALALELRDLETRGHTARVTALTLSLARSWGLTESRIVHLQRGAILHDIGKLGIPDAILLKPGRLTQEERAIIERHPDLARQMLGEIPFLEPAMAIPWCHHERWDGSGYPRGLRGEEIPLEARMFSVVDVWDALRSTRPYKEPWPAARVAVLLRDEAGRQFDPAVVDAFLALDMVVAEIAFEA